MAARETLQTAAKITALGTLTLLYPAYCPLCEASLELKRLRFVCAGCLEQMEHVEPPWCLRCGEPLEIPDDLCARCAPEKISFDRARSFGIYDGPLARLIQLLKFQTERALVRELAPLLAHVFEREGLADLVTGITFVPMSGRSQQARGFNQSELLARRLGRLVHKPVFTALWKLRETRPQVELSGQERLNNLQGAFAPRGPAVCQSVLLIDDVYTTGATVKECSRALRRAGYERVYVLTLARTRKSTAHIGPEVEQEDAG
jgi:ComF family protein